MTTAEGPYATGRRATSGPDEERAAMQASAKERKAGSRRGKGGGRAEGERGHARGSPRCRETERAMAERLHALVSDRAPVLMPKTYYGMPAYSKDGKTICFLPAAPRSSRFAIRRSGSSPRPPSMMATCGRTPMR